MSVQREHSSQDEQSLHDSKMEAHCSPTPEKLRKIMRYPRICSETMLMRYLTEAKPSV